MILYEYTSSSVIDTALTCHEILFSSAGAIMPISTILLSLLTNSSPLGRTISAFTSFTASSLIFFKRASTLNGLGVYPFPEAVKC